MGWRLIDWHGMEWIRGRMERMSDRIDQLVHNTSMHLKRAKYDECIYLHRLTQAVGNGMVQVFVIALVLGI